MTHFTCEYYGQPPSLTVIGYTAGTYRLLALDSDNHNIPQSCSVVWSMSELNVQIPITLIFILTEATNRSPIFSLVSHSATREDRAIWNMEWHCVISLRRKNMGRIFLMLRIRGSASIKGRWYSWENTRNVFVHVFLHFLCMSYRNKNVEFTQISTVQRLLLFYTDKTWLCIFWFSQS